MSDRQKLKRKARAYAAEHGVSYTAGLRAVSAQGAAPVPPVAPFITPAKPPESPDEERFESLTAAIASNRDGLTRGAKIYVHATWCTEDSCSCCPEIVTANDPRPSREIAELVEGRKPA